MHRSTGCCAQAPLPGARTDLQAAQAQLRQVRVLLISCQRLLRGVAGGVARRAAAAKRKCPQLGDGRAVGGAAAGRRLPRLAARRGRRRGTGRQRGGGRGDGGIDKVEAPSAGAAAQLLQQAVDRQRIQKPLVKVGAAHGQQHLAPARLRVLRSAERRGAQAGTPAACS